MWIVRLAIDRPYTFIVVSLLLAFTSIVTMTHMAVDIFPNIDIPVVSVVWGYTGLSPEEMEERIVTISERAMTTVTSDIEHMESISLSGLGIIRVFMHQGTDMGQAVGLMFAINQTELINMPPGITPPSVVAFSATDAPVMQLGVSSKVLTERQIYDYNLNFIRTRLATVEGASIPLPYGGKQRVVMVDLDPHKLMSKGVSANDVVTALGNQNLILPAGLARFGTKEFPIRTNSSPDKLDDFNMIPVKQINNGTIFIKDIGFAHDGNNIQTNIVRTDGHRGTLLNILRSGGASTLSVVQGIKDTLPLVKATMPKSLEIKILNDQSVFVRGAITQVIDEAITAAVLTGLLMLALLGSWRSTLIVAISIPLSIMTSILVLGLCGQTLNTMTLGGLSLAVGMLVDDATVEVENIHRNLDQKLPLREAVLTSASQVALPALVSTLSICIVFVPVKLLTEPSRSLFVPLGMAVIFAMLASYFLSRTLVPVMSVYLLRAEEQKGSNVKAQSGADADGQKGADADERKDTDDDGRKGSVVSSRSSVEKIQHSDWIGAMSGWVDERFNALRERYQSLQGRALENRKGTVCLFVAFYLLSCCLIPFIGQDFFPTIDAGRMRLHLICPVGTRIDETELYFSRVETAIRRIIPAEQITSIAENMGTPISGLSLCYGDNTSFTEFDGEMMITLNDQHHDSTFGYQSRIREMLAQDFPMLTYYFQPADITSQILNAGLQAPIDIQVTGLKHREENYKLALAIKHDVSLIPGAVDVLVRQALHQPQINVDVDRSKAIKLGLTQHDVASSLLTSLTSSFQTSPSFWVNPKNGVSYTVAVQTPLYRVTGTDDIRRTLITGPGSILANTAQARSLNNFSSTPRQGSSSTAISIQGAPAAQATTLAQALPTALAASQLAPSILTSPQATIPVSPSTSTSTSSATRSLVSPSSYVSAAVTSNNPALAGTNATPLINTALFAHSPNVVYPINNAPYAAGSSSAATTSSSSVNGPAYQATASSQTSSSIQTTPSSAPVTPTSSIANMLSTPSSGGIPSYTASSSANSAPSTLPISGQATTVTPGPATAHSYLTAPGALTTASTAAVASVTTPSFLSIPSYLTTFAGPSAASAAAANFSTAPPLNSATPPPASSGTAAGASSAGGPGASPGTGAAFQLTPGQGSSTGLGIMPGQSANLTEPAQGPITSTGSSSSTQSASSNASMGSASSAGSGGASPSPYTNGLGVHGVTTTGAGVSSLLMNLATTRRSPTSAMVSHYAIQPVFDVYANTENRDLGGVAHDVQKVIDHYRKQAPVGTIIYMRGQADSMNQAFGGLFEGIIFALILIYLLLAMNFQSWLDPLIILMAIPGALCGVIWALFFTQTTCSVPVLMGAIMTIGVGSANSILMVNFANEEHKEGAGFKEAMAKAGAIRFRPVLMTATAMIIGMLPMSLGLGEGGGQNAPLGRAVIGGLIVATLSTLFFMPVVYSLIKKDKNTKGTAAKAAK